MTEPGSFDPLPHVIPPEALPHWQALAGILAREGPAVCETSDAEAWWPFSRDDACWTAQMAAAACSRCPALDACRAYALAAAEAEGIWGGTTPRERERLRRAAA